MNKKNRLAIGVIAAVLILACACPVTSLPSLNGNDSTQPTIEIPSFPTSDLGNPPVNLEPAGNILYSDDFSADSGEMETFSDDNGSVGINTGAYVVTSNTGLWNWGRSQTDYGDTVIEFDATMVSGPSTNVAGLGIYCRFSLSDDTSVNGYLLAIGTDGYYAILNFSGGSPSPLVDWAYSDVINQGTATNRVRATCNGDELKLEVNGELLASTNTVAGSVVSGPFAFAAVSFEDTEPTIEAHFDNLVVTAP